MVEGKLPMPWDTQAGVRQDSILSPTLYGLYINDTPQTPGVYLALCADDTHTNNQSPRGLCTYSENCSMVSPSWYHGVNGGT